MCHNLWSWHIYFNTVFSTKNQASLLFVSVEMFYLLFRYQRQQPHHPVARSTQHSHLIVCVWVLRRNNSISVI